MYKKDTAENIASEISVVINPAKRIKDLEKNLEFSDSYQNRVNLADALFEMKDYEKAYLHYSEALKDTTQNNFYVLSKLVELNYANEDYKQAISFAEQIKDDFEFKKSKVQFIYGLCLDKLGDFESAENHLSQINIRYSFYEERVALAEFLITRGKKEEAKVILEDIIVESENMTKTNKRVYKTTINKASELLSQLN